MTPPTSKALEEAVERAAEARWDSEMGHGAWRLLDKSWKEAERAFAKVALQAAFPGLFDGTMWLAPWKATEDMRSACRKLTDPIYSLLSGEHLDYDPEDCVFAAMRDAYLNAERKE